MPNKPTATLRVEWQSADRKLRLKEVTAIDVDGRPVALKVLSVTPNPATETDPERKLLDYARKVAVHAELVGATKRHLEKVSRDGAQSARGYIREAMVRLRALEQSLSDRIGE
jgi:hypothetical protein